MRLIVVLIVSSVFVGTALGQVDLCQETDLMSVGGAVFTESDSHPTSPGFAAESVVLQLSDTITNIDWRGLAYDSLVSADCDPTDEFTISLYEDNGAGLPGVLIDSYLFGSNVDRQSTGEFVAVGSNLEEVFEYSVELTPPFEAPATGTYWIEILNASPALDTCHWGWMASPDGDGSAAFNVLGILWTSQPRDLDICLNQVEPTGTVTITEIMATSKKGHRGNFVEVRNCSSAAVDLGRLTDLSDAPSHADNLLGVTLAAGETIVITPVAAADFVDLWDNGGTPALAQIVQVTPGAWPKFGFKKDSVQLYDSAGVLLDIVNYEQSCEGVKIFGPPFGDHHDVGGEEARRHAAGDPFFAQRSKLLPFCPESIGNSIALSAGSVDAADNDNADVESIRSPWIQSDDDAGSWTAAGEHGSPGVAESCN